MQPGEKAYEQLDYYEQGIVNDLMSAYGHSAENALRIVNEYLPVLHALDRYDNTETYAERFHSAFQRNVSGKSWLARIRKLSAELNRSGDYRTKIQ